MNLTTSIRGLMTVVSTLASLSSCSSEPLDLKCHKYNDSTILLNTPTNGRIDDPSALTTDVSLGAITPAMLDLVSESHALSSTPLPHETYLTVVDNECGEKKGKRYLLAYAKPEETLVGKRGVYFLQDRIFPRDLSVLFHEIGHLQECGDGGEAIAVLNHLEQTVMSFGMLYGAKYEGSPLADQVGFAHPFYYESFIEAQRMALIYDQEYFMGLIAAAHYLLQHDGDFTLVRERYVKSRTDKVECRTLGEIKQELKPYYEDVFTLMGSKAELFPQRLAALREFWPTLKDAYMVMANPIQEKFGEEAAEYWRQFVEEREFPDVELLE